MTFLLNNRRLKQHTVLTHPPRLAKTRLSPGKAAGEKQLEAYPLGYVKDCFDLRSPLGDCFSSRLVQTC